jgi:WD40 repeat protein
MTFGSKISSVTIQNAASQVRINPSTVYGWNNQSIKKNKTGVGLGDYNLRSYGNGDQTVTYAELPTELIYNNSNEIARLAPIVRTNSNAGSFGIKNNSNTIMRAITSNSYGIITISKSVRTNSNAFARSIRNNSDSILTLNSTTSNAIQQTPIFYNDHIILGNNSITQGLKRFNNGFTIWAGQSATIDTCLSVSGGFSLQETGQLNLRGNLRLDGNTTLTSGGTIYGQYTGLILDGNLTLATNKVLHLRGNTFIDGNGHFLSVGDNAQIFVDTDATVTLRNLVVRNGQHTQTFPPIKLASHGSKLCLDNTMLAPGNDFLFPQGQFFVHNDVKFTGTSAFIFTSPVPSWITSNSRLFFDIGTTFSIAPATFTDAPYRLNTTYVDCNFIKMTDKSSQLYLDGCSLYATHTGVRFTKGSTYLNNTVNCISDSTITMTGLIPRVAQLDYGAYLHSFSWSHDGKLLAVAGNTPTSNFEIQIYSFNGSSLTLVDSKDYGGSGSDVWAITWSPDDQFLALGGNAPTSGNEIQIYSFNGSSLNLVDSKDYGTTIYAIDWSPDGRFLAIGGDAPTSGDEIQIYSFNGTSLHFLTSQNYDLTVRAVNWSPDGRFLAIGGNGNPVRIYSFNGTSLTLIDSKSYGTTVYSVHWSPDGRFLAIAGYVPSTYEEIQIYRFNGSSLTYVTSQNYGLYALSVQWSPSGNALAVGGQISIIPPYDGNHIQIYRFDGSTLTSVANQKYGTNVWAVRWSPDGYYLAAGGEGPTSTYEIQINKSCFGSIATPQALSKSIVFGDSAKGADYDADVTLLGGARIEVQGKVNYDCVS